MRRILLLLLVTVVQQLSAQNPTEKPLKTEIREVTVFLNSAQIFESGNVALSSGTTTLKVINLSPYIDEKSIQVKGDGNFTILSVNHKLNYLNALRRDVSIDSLHDLKKKITESIQRDQARLAVLNEKTSLLHANKSLGGSTNGVSIAQLKQALQLFEEELEKVKAEELRITGDIEEKKQRHTKIDQQLKELNDRSIMPTGEIEIRVSAVSPLTGKFRISYIVGNAGWFPKYDVRVDNIKKPLAITYKAEVFQNTGVDWKNVKLRFSNANPVQSGMIPSLNAWNLSYSRFTSYGAPKYGPAALMSDPNLRFVRGRVVDSSNEPVPGANIVVKGTTLGTATDAEGNYMLTLPDGPSTLVISFVGYHSQEVPVTKQDLHTVLNENVSELSEVVVVGYGQTLGGRVPGVTIRGASSINAKSLNQVSKPLPTTTIENQTTVEIEVTDPYTIRSNGQKMLVDLKNIEVDALFEYYAVPKLDKDAFLVARIVQWDQYNLLEGEANLYFEDAFVGRSILNARTMKDTLDISLGRDKNIVVGREKVKEFCKRRVLGSNVSETRGFRILVRNKKSQPINVTIFDQVPLPIVSDINVITEELSSGTLDKPTGKVTWQLKIEPQQQKEIIMRYEVKFPRKENVILE